MCREVFSEAAPGDECYVYFCTLTLFLGFGIFLSISSCRFTRLRLFYVYYLFCLALLFCTPILRGSYDILDPHPLFTLLFPSFFLFFLSISNVT